MTIRFGLQLSLVEALFVGYVDDAAARGALPNRHFQPAAATIRIQLRLNQRRSFERAKPAAASPRYYCGFARHLHEQRSASNALAANAHLLTSR